MCAPHALFLRPPSSLTRDILSDMHLPSARATHMLHSLRTSIIQLSTTPRTELNGKKKKLTNEWGVKGNSELIEN